MDKPKKLQIYFNALMKEACRNSYVELMEDWGLNEEETEECENYICEMLDVYL